MKICVIDFNKKAELLKDKLLKGKSFEKLQANIAPKLCTDGLFAAFISVCDRHERAKVFRATGDTLEGAWNNVCNAARRHISSKELDPVWVKADIMRKADRKSLADVITTVTKNYNEYFRHGLSFDDKLETALLEAEMNGSRVISYKAKTIELSQVNKHLKTTCGIKLEALPEEVIVFDCCSAFCDEELNTYTLYDKGYNMGRRLLKEFDKQTAYDVISTSSEYLSMQLDLSGKFEYGVYPVFHKNIPGYNILRHASSIWSLVCAYRITKDRFTLRQVECALGYLVKNSFYKYKKPRDEENTAYIAELEKNEVKLGANAVSILVMTEYMDAVGSDKYKKLCVELGNGILELFNSETGEFFHVLNFPDLSEKDKVRTVYYDGEAVFALARLYSITGDQRWLDAACTAIERFIRDDYIKYRDHWIAYAMNEVTKYVHDERYYEFALKNAQLNLKRIHDQKTTYHTYLELLCVTFELYTRIIESGEKVEYLNEFDVYAFVDTIFHRAHFMLNGYCYPEYVMYLKYPERLLGAFFVRHDGYRIRIDDIQHFCGAYYSLYRSYEKLDALRKEGKENKVTP